MLSDWESRLRLTLTIRVSTDVSLSWEDMDDGKPRQCEAQLLPHHHTLGKCEQQNQPPNLKVSHWL